MVVARDGGGVTGKMGEAGKRYKLPVIKQIRHGDTTYCMVTTVNNAVLHI